MPTFKENKNPIMKSAYKKGKHSSAYKMKYQGVHSAFPFKESPIKQNDDIFGIKEKLTKKMFTDAGMEYVRKTEKQEVLEQEYRTKQYNHMHEYRLKYEKLQSKYNALMLKPILQGLVDNIEELQYALEKGNNWWSIVNYLTGVVKGVDEDITNKLEV